MQSEHRHPSMTQITLLLLSSLAVMSGASLSAALPLIQDHFKLTPNVEFWTRMMLTTPALFILIFAPLAGMLIDWFGRKKLLLLGVILYGIFGSSGFYVRSIPLLLIGRAGIGMAIAIIYTTTTALIADYYHGKARARFLGLQAGFMSTSAVLFHPLGGALADLGWHVTFLIYGTAFLFLPLAAIFLYEPSHKAELPLIQPSQGKRFSREIPMVALAAIYGLTFLGQIIFYTIPVQMPFYLRALEVGSMGMIGLFTGFGSLLMGVSGFLYGRISNNLSYPAVTRLGFSLAAAGFLMIGFAKGLEVLFLGLLLSGLGLGLNTPNLVAWLVSLTPVTMRGRALGTRLTFNYLGQFLSPIVFQPVIAASGIPAAYLAAAGLGIFVVIISLIVKSKATAVQ